MRKMKLSALFLTLILALSLSVGALGIDPRYDDAITCMPTLSFSGTSAECAVFIRTERGFDIDGTMTLYRVSGSTPVKLTSWSFSGTTSVSVKEYYKVTSGQTYRLVVDVTADTSSGTEYITREVTATCR